MPSTIFARDSVSIHAPREGRDSDVVVRAMRVLSFQSTRPVRGATKDSTAMYLLALVSIHAPREGRDPPAFVNFSVAKCFNPRAP